MNWLIPLGICLIIFIIGTFFISQTNITAAWNYANKECVKQGWEQAGTIETNWFSNIPSKYNCITYAKGVDLNSQA